MKLERKEGFKYGGCVLSLNGLTALAHFQFFSLIQTCELRPTYKNTHAHTQTNTQARTHSMAL